MKLARLLLLGALSAPLALGCSVQLPGDEVPYVPGVPAALQGEWKQIQLAHENVAYQGERRVTFSVELGVGEPIQTKYVERVSSDGTGRFNILPLWAETLVVPDESVFLLLQERREGFFFRYRDFRVRDLAAFLTNYKNLGQGISDTVAGRSAWQVTFVRKTTGGRHYRVWFDVATGLVLKYEEYDKSGTLVAGTEFLWIDFTPDLSDVTYHVPGNNERPIDLATEDAQAILGFTPRMPLKLPPGFVLLETARVTDDAGNHWFKVGYTDGVEMLFFLHREQDKQIFQLPVSSSVRKTKSQDEVTLFKAGPVLVAAGTLDDHELIAIGEVSETDLLDMVNSAE